MGKKSLILIWVGVTLSAVASCQRETQEVDESLYHAPLANSGQHPPPTVDFPRENQTDDLGLNKFIEHALSICAAGDYDGFRQLFASAYTPPKESDFARIWGGIKTVQIVSVHADRQEPPNYYVHVVVQLRQPDARQRTRLDAVIAVLREGEEWRHSPAPKEVEHKVLVVDSQPARDRSEGTSTHPAHESRPASGPGV